MTDQHPITPPPELVQQWLTEGRHQDYCSATEHAIAQAAKWGADQARRPKPPSLAEEALVACERSAFGIPGDRDTIRRALERLQHLEQESNDN